MKKRVTLLREEIERLKPAEIEAESRAIHSDAGILIFFEKENPLFHIRTNNLNNLFNILFVKRDKNIRDKLSKILDRYSSIDWVMYENQFTALVAEKRLIYATKPEFLGFIRLTDAYVYLALNVRDYPYITIQEVTTGDSLYLGPFNDRFFLVEVIEIFAKYLKTPSCQPYFTESQNNEQVKLLPIENKQYQACSKLNTEQCKQYCKLSNPEDLSRAFKDTFLSVNTHLLSELEREYRSYFDDLQFLKADEIKNDIITLQKYYLQLQFLMVIKELEYVISDNGVDYFIKKGLLEKITKGNLIEVFDFSENKEQEYRNNEKLAVPKDYYPEMWSIFEKIEKMNPEIIQQLLDEADKRK